MSLALSDKNPNFFAFNWETLKNPLGCHDVEGGMAIYCSH